MRPRTAEANPADHPPRPGRASAIPGVGWLSAIRLVAVALALALFGRHYDWQQPQLLVPGLWLAAIVLWSWDVRSRRAGPAFGLAVPATDLKTLAVLLAVFAAGWLPFYDNWRWAYTGDSISFFGMGYHLHGSGLRQNLLSVRGVDNFYTYLWEVSYNVWMMLLGPTFFAHRFGLFFMACLALASTYALYAILLGRGWATAIVVATATNYVWLWMSYVSYLRMDGILFFNLMLVWATLIGRHPDRLGLYLLCGLTAGLSVFYTPATWGTVGLAGAFALGVALIHRNATAVAVLGVSTLLAAAPALLEIPWFLQMLRDQAMVPQAPQPPTFEYVARIFREILLSPYDSPITRLGGQGAFLRAPLGAAYLVGCAVAVLALVPPLRRRLRIPAAAAPLLLLLLANAVLFALTNKGYANFSHKRTYVIIPLQVFFAVLPAVVLFEWGRAWRWWRHGVAILVVASLAVYAGRNFQLIYDPPRLTYGVNVFDGLIELRQRYPDTPVVLLTSRETIRNALRPEEMVAIGYRLLDTTRVEGSFSDAVVEDACRRRGLLCYEPTFDRESMAPLLRAHASRLEPFPLLNSAELVCVRCRGE